MPKFELEVSPLFAEIGSTTDFLLDTTYTPGEEASASIEYFRGSTSVHSGDLNDYTDSYAGVTSGITTYKATLTYTAGTAPSTLPAGSIDRTVNVEGKYAYMAYSGTQVPTDGAAVRAGAEQFTQNNMGGVSLESPFGAETTQTNTVFVIAVPTGTVIDKIEDIGGQYPVDLTFGDGTNGEDYVKSTSILQVPDAAGNNVNYDVYIMQTLVPYSYNHTHVITIQ